MTVVCFSGPDRLDVRGPRSLDDVLGVIACFSVTSGKGDNGPGPPLQMAWDVLSRHSSPAGLPDKAQDVQLNLSFRQTMNTKHDPYDTRDIYTHTHKKIIVHVKFEID